MGDNKKTERTEAVLETLKSELDEQLVQEAAGLIRANGLHVAVAFWLSRGEKGRTLVRALCRWWGRCPDTSVLWPRPVETSENISIKVLDSLLALEPRQAEILAEEAEVFLTELKYAMAS